MNVYFTVDTESSMAASWNHPERRPLKADRHVFCRINGRDYGIGLITSILGAHGFRATHFVETLATLVNGSDDTRAIFDYLLAHEQDVQLHAHPCYRFYADFLRAQEANQPYSVPETADFIGSFNEKRQFELLHEAADLFRHFAGRPPEAFRAGCFSANRVTMRCLGKLNISLDSSFNPCYAGWSFTDQGFIPNRVSYAEGVWEIPVTVARTPLPESRNRFKHADISSLSVRELRQMLESGVAAGQLHFVILFHSFSAVKPKNETYEQTKPDRIVIRRFEELVRFLADNPSVYRVSTFGELAAKISSLQEEQTPIPELGIAAAGVRKAVQAINRFYWV